MRRRTMILSGVVLALRCLAPVQAVPSDGMFVLPVQRRVTDADGKEKVVTETWKVPPKEVAFVTMHFWNFGDDDGVPVPENLCVADGTLRNALHARLIDYLYVKPTLDAAREAGMTVIHAQPGWIAVRYKQHQALVAEMTSTPEQPVKTLPPRPQYTDEERAKWTADTWPDREYLDFPTLLKPLPSEPVVMTKEELNYLLQKQGIKTLIYVGYATNCCVIEYNCGMKDMVKKLGYRACLLREATLATECQGEDGVQKTAEALDLIEREYGATASVADFKTMLQPPRPPFDHNLLSSHLGWPASVPGQNYYPQEISDQLLQDWKEYFVYMNELGYNEIGIWCLLTYRVPVPLGVDTKGIGPHADDIRVTSEKVKRCREMIRSAHSNGVKLHYGFCFYSWHVDDIIDVYPDIRQDKNGGVMCGMYPGNPDKGVPASQQLMKDAIDFVVEQLPELDGFWISSGDRGRCKCESCLAKFPDTLRGRMEYFAATDIPLLDYIKQKYPDKTLAYCTEVLNEAMEHPDNYDILKRFASSVDIHLWGNLYPEGDRIVQRLAADCPETDVLFYQRPWQSTPPADQERDSWFLPNLVHPLGEDIHRRGDVIDWSGIMACPLPKDNPGDNISMRFLIRMMNQSHEDPVIVVKELLYEWYDPRTLKALDELFMVFDGVERAFRKHWPTWFMHIDMVPDGLGALSKSAAWTPEQAVDYINANQLALARLRAIKPELGNQAEADRLETSIVKWIKYIQQRMKQKWDYEMP